MQSFFWKYWISRLVICSPHVAQHGGRWRLEFSSYPVIKAFGGGVAHAEPTLLVENARLRLPPLLLRRKEKLARASDNAGFGRSEDELAVHPTNKQPHRPALNLKHKVAAH